MSEISFSNPLWDVDGSLERLEEGLVKSRQELKVKIEEPLRTGGSRSGKLYPVPGIPGAYHQASAVYEVPAPRTFTLANSWEDRQVDKLKHVVESTALYAPILEDWLQREITDQVTEEYRPHFFENMENALKGRG